MPGFILLKFNYTLRHHRIRGFNMKSETRLEKSLQRLMKHLENGDAVLIISGCRNGNSCDINLRKMKTIRYMRNPL